MKLPGWIARPSPPAQGARGARAAQLYDQGCALRAKGELDGAIDSYRGALELDPALLPAARDLAIAWLELGDIDQAEYFSRLAIGLNPSSAELHVHLGNVLGKALRHEEALECFQRAIALQPNLALAHNNLGTTFKTLGRAAEAIAQFRMALELNPALASAHANLGIGLQEEGRLDEAQSYYRAALTLDPGLLEVLLNLGILHEQRGELAPAMRYYDKALALRPDFAQAHVNRAMQRLLKGDFEHGWEEYEWRWRLPELVGREPYDALPRWSGERLQGRTILLFCEQGYGDNIQFVRYAPLVAASGAKVILECTAKLKPLFTGMAGIDDVVLRGEAPPYIDCCAPLMSLPRLMGTTLKNIPESPYLRPDPAASARWREKLAADGAPRLKVGLFWASDAPSRIAHLKSISLEALAPLARVGGVKYYSLQRGAAARQVAQAPAGMDIVDLSAELADFADDAALISALDLVISVDTATAHLSGALGCRTWTLTHFPTDWRWLLDRTDTPWYPSMRLFRQSRTHDWSAVVDELAQALSALRDAGP